MKTKYKLLLPVFFALLCMLPKGQVKTEDKIYYNLFNKAEKLFTGEAGEYNDTLALKYFSEIIQHVSNSPEHALLLYNCHERSGILQQGLGYTSKEILQQFYTSLDIYKANHLKDSILFRLLLSTGNTHYTDGLFDSSVFYYSWADKVIQQYPQAGLAGDLYNSLGALYSESGDYKQSGNYFSKALEITKKTKPELKEAIFAMSVNIASALRLSGQLDSAIHLYKKLLQPDAPSAPLLNNIGRIYLAKKIPDSALYYLQQVKDATGVYSIPYNNSLALAYMQKGDTVMATKYLNAATGIFHKNPQQVKSNYYGNTCKYIGDLKVMEKLPAEALTYYQRAIMQLNFKFNDENIFSNPTNFIGDFASYDLFEALLAKAGCFALLYEADHKEENFTAAKKTYETSFVLADYIKKSIDNDEARLFIADKVFDGYKKAVAFIMQEYHRTSDQDLTILALKWISKSRATSLAISLKENSIKQFAGLPDSLLQKEKNIKINISRLKLQLKQVADSSAQNEILSGINNAEFQLNQVTNAYRRFPDYYRQKFASDSINIASIQQNILDNNSAIICYFTGEKSIMAFVIKRSAIVYQDLPDDSLLTQQLKSFSESLVENNTGKNNEYTFQTDYTYP
ncbi:MAG: tetratricopeptide repeat protein, partial [Panacibacter sp.]